MTDAERFRFVNATGANIVWETGETLVPRKVRVCVNRITGWHEARKAEDAIDACERDYRSVCGEWRTGG